MARHRARLPFRATGWLAPADAAGRDRRGKSGSEDGRRVGRGGRERRVQAEREEGGKVSSDPRSGAGNVGCVARGDGARAARRRGETPIAGRHRAARTFHPRCAGKGARRRRLFRGRRCEGTALQRRRRGDRREKRLAHRSGQRGRARDFRLDARRAGDARAGRKAGGECGWRSARAPALFRVTVWRAPAARPGGRCAARRGFRGDA